MSGVRLGAGLNRAGNEVRGVGSDRAAIRETASWANVVLLAALWRTR